MLHQLLVYLMFDGSESLLSSSSFLFSLSIISSLISAKNLAENLFLKSTNTEAEKGALSLNSFKPIKN